MINIAELLTANAAVQLVVTAADLKPVRIGGGLVRYRRKDVQQIARQA